MAVYVRLAELLKERNMTQKQLAEETGLRPATISEIVNNQRSAINRDHMSRICEVLKIEDIGDLITMKDD